MESSININDNLAGCGQELGSTSATHDAGWECGHQLIGDDNGRQDVAPNKERAHRSRGYSLQDLVAAKDQLVCGSVEMVMPTMR
jgi:hypothetical protein